jgi:hypothetical protein
MNFPVFQGNISSITNGLTRWLLKVFQPGFLVFFALALTCCSEENITDQYPFILLKHADGLTQDGASVPIGGQMKFGISAVGGGVSITNLRVKRISADASIVELDRGMFLETGGLDTTLVYVKGEAEQETWNFFIQNRNRDTASMFITIYKGDGSAYGNIFYYPSIALGYPNNSEFANFLDLSSGAVYTSDNVSGHEQEIDLAAFYYITSGLPSPTLTCPGYTSAITWYPMFADWSVKNSTTYDYKTSDNDLVSAEQFDAAENDSLLVSGYKPQNVSGLCKYCYTGKVIPFKTSGGKYGMVKVLRADEQEGGSMEIAVKIQQ